MRLLPALLVASLTVTSCYTLSLSNSSGSSVSALSEAIVALDDMRLSEEYEPREEYYLGRGSSAGLIENIPAADTENADTVAKLEYLNLLLAMLWQASADVPRTGRELGNHIERRPEDLERLAKRMLFQGTTAGILESQKTGVYGMPGGFIWFTQGALDLCRTEDQLAALESIQLAHVLLDHPLESYRQRHRSRIITSMLFGLREEDDSVSGNFGHLVASLCEDTLAHGYSESQSLEADRFACWTLLQAGYNPNALLEVFQSMQQVDLQQAEATPWLEHQAPLEERSAQIARLIEDEDMRVADTYMIEAESRQARFNAALGR